jgi:hypothetical protein
VNVANNGGWSRVTNAVVHSTAISDGAFRCLLVLRSHCINKTVCWPGEETLAAELGCSLSTVGRRVAELERLRLIKVKRRGLGRTNIYTLLEEFSPGADGSDLGANRRSSTTDPEQSQATGLSVSSRSEMVVYDPSNLTDRSRGSSELNKAPSGGAAGAARPSFSSKDLVAFYVREFRTRLKTEPPRDEIGQVAKVTQKLVSENCDGEIIERAIQILIEQGKTPRSLPRLYVQAAAERRSGNRKLSWAELLELPEDDFKGPLFRFSRDQ